MSAPHKITRVPLFLHPGYMRLDRGRRGQVVVTETFPERRQSTTTTLELDAPTNGKETMSPIACAHTDVVKPVFASMPMTFEASHPSQTCQRAQNSRWRDRNTEATRDRDSQTWNLLWSSKWCHAHPRASCALPSNAVISK